jgi:hypothetical protein
MLEYRMRRLVRQSRLEDPASCSYTSRAGGRFSETMERGFAEWDVSGIPDSAIIDSVFCASNCFSLSTEVRSVELYHMTNRPSITSNPLVLFNDAGDGALYGAYPDPAIGWQVRRLGDAARSDLQSSLSVDWFAIGYTGTGLSVDWRVQFAGFQTDTAPRLIVYYSLSGQKPGWYEKSPLPGLIKAGAWLTYNAGTDLVYAASGSNFYSYFPAPDSWHQLATWPLGAGGRPPSKGSVGCADGSGYVYATKGNNTLAFWRYDIVRDSWQERAQVPLGPSNKKVKGGTDLAYAFRGDSGYAYLLKGYKNEFFRYDPLADSWIALPPAPVGANQKWDKGSWLAYDSDHNRIYAHKSKYQEFYYYDVNRDSWSGPMHATPIPGSGGSKKCKEGSCGAFYRGSIYALKGGNTQEFWRYSTASDSWVEMETIPSIGSTGKKKKVKAGADITATTSALYATKGNKSGEFWMYSPGVFGFTPEVSRSAQASGGLAIGDWRLAISPNPLAGGFATVCLTRPLESSNPRILLSVFNVAGQTVLSRALSVGREASSVVLDLRHLSSGVYLVKLQSENFTATQKLMVKR